MMKLIGFKRLLILGIMLGLNLFFGVVYMLAVDPLQSQAQSEYDAVTNEIGGLQGRIQNIKHEMAEFQKNLPKYEDLKTRGFFLDQDRFRMSRDLDALRASSGIKAFSYNIADIKDVPNATATTAQMKVINSRIDVNNVMVLTDEEFYKFLDQMQTQFPPQVRLQSFRVARATDFGAQTLQTIASGQPARTVEATAVFDWYTLVPITATADPNNPQGATAPGAKP